MQLKTVSPDLARLYDQDFLLWTQETGRLHRAGRLDELDIEHIANYISVRKPSRPKCRSEVSASRIRSRRMVVMEMQSTRL